MPNIKSAKKRALQAEKRSLVNTARRTAMKTAIKKVLAAVEAKDVEQAQILLKDAEAKISRAKGKHVLHANTAARKVSAIAKKVAAITKAASAK